MARNTAIALGLWLTYAVANAQVAACPGDCNGDGQVTIDELERLVAIAPTATATHVRLPVRDDT